MPQLSVFFDNATYIRLVQEAGKRGVSASAVVRGIVMKHYGTVQGGRKA